MFVIYTLLVGLAAALFAGCSDGTSTVPVTGVITFAGSPPPAQGAITFAPIEAAEGMTRRPGTGSFKPDHNTFEVTSFQPGDGLLPGRYAVNISCYTGIPSAAKPETYVTLNAVPQGWSPDELEIEIGSDPIEVNYDVPPKK